MAPEPGGLLAVMVSRETAPSNTFPSHFQVNSADVARETSASWDFQPSN